MKYLNRLPFLTIDSNPIKQVDLRDLLEYIYRGYYMSLNDTALTKVTYGKYATRVPDEVAYGIYEWFSSQ